MLGCCILGGMSLPRIRNKVQHLEIYAAGLALVLILLIVVFNFGALFTSALGRNMTLTGRTEIWQRLLQTDTNPLIGTGYYSFWLDNYRVEQVSKGFYYQLNEAHNGYIETYLNSGFIGLFLLIALLVSAAIGIKRQMVMEGGSYATMRLAFLVIAMTYGVTEAGFNRLGIIWFACLLAFVNYPHVQDFVVNDRIEEVREQDDKSKQETVVARPPAHAFTV
jgi:O-antigen ligase